MKSQPVYDLGIPFIHEHLPLINHVCSLNFPGCSSADGQHKAFGGLGCLPALLHSVCTYRSVFGNHSVWKGDLLPDTCPTFREHPDVWPTPPAMNGHRNDADNATHVLCAMTRSFKKHKGRRPGHVTRACMFAIWEHPVKMIRHGWKISNQHPAAAIFVAATRRSLWVTCPAGCCLRLWARWSSWILLPVIKIIKTQYPCGWMEPVMQMCQKKQQSCFGYKSQRGQQES